MSLVVAVLAVALVLGWARGGSLERLGALPLRSSRLVVAALLAQLAGTVVGGPFYPLGLAVSAGLVVAFLARNRGIRGTGLVALGLLANALVVGLNGAMPVSAQASARAGVGIQDLLTGGDARHEPAGPGTRLRWLGDAIPLPLPLRPEVLSPGDVLVAAGLGQLVALGMIGAAATSTVQARTVQSRTVQSRTVQSRQGRPRRALPPLTRSPATPSRRRLPALPPPRSAPPPGG